LYTDDSGIEIPLSFLFVTKFGVKMPLFSSASSGLGLKSITETFINVRLRESSKRSLEANFRLANALESLFFLIFFKAEAVFFYSRTLPTDGGASFSYRAYACCKCF
jgi:hypothetical protein